MSSDSIPRICIVAGARPNFMKIAPIIRELNSRSDLFTWELVHTGQHYDHGMSEVFFEELGIPQPNAHLGAGGGTHAEQTARVMLGFERYCIVAKPDLVIVVGDVDSTLACSIVTKKLGIRLAHVEAGLRSGDRAMPEEINRIVTDSISDIFFVTEESGTVNLTKEGHNPEDIHFVGHVMIDNLFYQLGLLREHTTREFETDRLKKVAGRYCVVTLHRPSNVDNENTLRRIIDALGVVANVCRIIFPIHPRTSANLEKFGISLPENIITTKPLPYMEFLNLWKDAQLILTDSGGLQEESTALGVPCITLRNSTERPITVTMGTNRLAGTDSEKIASFALKILSTPHNTKLAHPPLWDGQSAGRILETLSRYLKRT